MTNERRIVDGNEAAARIAHLLSEVIAIYLPLPLAAALGADLLQPGVTVVAQDPRRIGALAAELALDPAGSGVHLVPTQLIARGSGEIPANSGQRPV